MLGHLFQDTTMTQFLLCKQFLFLCIFIFCTKGSKGTILSTEKLDTGAIFRIISVNKKYKINNEMTIDKMNHILIFQACSSVQVI